MDTSLIIGEVAQRHYAQSSSRALGSISWRSIKSRVSLLKQPLCLHNPGCGFVFAAEAWDRPELTTCCRHLDIKGAIALRRYLECRDCHAGQYVAPSCQCNLFSSFAE
jgi:hypothetical protein